MSILCSVVPIRTQKQGITAYNSKQYSCRILFQGQSILGQSIWGVHWGSPWTGSQCFVHHRLFLIYASYLELIFEKIQQNYQQPGDCRRLATNYAKLTDIQFLLQCLFQLVRVQEKLKTEQRPGKSRVGGLTSLVVNVTDHVESGKRPRHQAESYDSTGRSNDCESRGYSDYPRCHLLEETELASVFLLPINQVQVQGQDIVLQLRMT